MCGGGAPHRAHASFFCVCVCGCRVSCDYFTPLRIILYISLLSAAYRKDWGGGQATTGGRMHQQVPLGPRECHQCARQAIHPEAAAKGGRRPAREATPEDIYTVSRLQGGSPPVCRKGFVKMCPPPPKTSCNYRKPRVFSFLWG